MTIKELEEKTGLARANIRYYEQQGLVHPARQENGYRDYSEEDLETLRKVKLLRHLGLGIDTIRAVQRGAQPLGEALAAREEELSGEAALLAREKAVCRELRGSGIAYDTLQPETYLAALEREEAAAPAWAPRPEKRDLIQTVGHPWRRYFARHFDLGFYGLLWSAVWMGIFRNGLDGLGADLLNWLLSLLLMVFLEPLLLSRFGTTPGKAIFGLHVSALDGGKPTYGEAAHWTRGVLYHGMGLGIPFVELWCNWKSYCRCANGEAEPWEEDINYTIRDTRPWRIVLFLAMEGLLFALLVPLTLRDSAPPHCGALTKADYIDNINYIAELTDYGMRMDESGQWGYNDYGAYDVYVDGELVTRFGTQAIPEILVDENGVVTGIEISFSARAEGSMVNLPLQTAMAYYALAAYDTDPLGIGYAVRAGKFDADDLDLSQSGDLTYGPISIAWDVNCRGFEVWEDSWLSADGSTEEPSYACTVTLTLTE